MGPVEYVIDLILSNSDPTAAERPSNERIFLETYQGKNSGKITEQDLRPQEIDFLKQLIQYRESTPPRRHTEQSAFGQTTYDMAGLTNTVAEERLYYAGEVAKYKAQRAKYEEQLKHERNPIMRKNLERWIQFPANLAEHWENSKNNPNKGVPIGYDDYAKAAAKLGDATLEKEDRTVPRGKTPAGAMETLLGRFTYGIDLDGNVIITDTYDFNPPQGKYGAEGAAGNIYQTVRKLAGDKIPPGKGREVQINLGKIIQAQQKGKP